MDLYDEQLIEIASAVRAFRHFTESQFKYKHIAIEWPEDYEIVFTVTNRSGDTLGFLKYTDDVEIGFVTNN